MATLRIGRDTWELRRRLRELLFGTVNVRQHTDKEIIACFALNHDGLSEGLHETVVEQWV
jgi:hypothetical protein